MKILNIYRALVFLFSISMLLSCTNDISFDDANIRLELFASFGSTRANMNIKENSLDIVSRWVGSDHIQVYCAKNGTSYLNEAKDVSISDISENGETAKFIFYANESWKEDGEISEDSKFACFTNRCFPQYDSEQKKLFINASLLRNPIENFNAPVYAIGEFSEHELLPVNFQHYYAYELLHIINNTNNPLTFSLNGFEGVLWFKSRGSICIDDGEFYHESVATRDPVEYTDMTIPPYDTGILMSAYIPNEQKINNVRMVTTLNGNTVKTSNTLSSDAEIYTGHAYHMYATWDGKELKFGKDETPGVVIEEGFVDLGLSSGNLWYATNMGTESSKNSGNYYAWGETTGFNEGKTTFSWSNYKYCRGTQNSLTKYCSKAIYGNNNYTDSYSQLQQEDDVAAQTFGDPYCIPTKEDWDELIRECSWLKSENGVQVKGKNGNIIFLPCAGYRQGANLYDEGTEGYYWTSTLDVNSPDDAWYVYIGDGKAKDYDYYRCSGRSVRPIMRNVSNGSSAKAMVPAKNKEPLPTEAKVGGGLVVKTISRSSENK